MGFVSFVEVNLWRETMDKRIKMFCFIALITIMTGMLGCVRQEAPQEKEKQSLNVLGWIGYDEERLIRPFEEQYGVDVNVKTYIGGDEMFSIMSQTRGEYDVVVIDPEYIEKLYATGRLQPLNEEDYNFQDYIKPFDRLSTAYINNQLYAVVIRYGTNALVYNTKYFTEDEVASYTILWSEKANGKIGIWDWYLPVTGVLSMADGNSDNPYQLTDEEFASLRQKVLSLKPQVQLITSSLADLKQALANEDIIIAPGVGTYLVAYDLKKQGLPIESVIPSEGGIMWIETLGIPNDARNPELAKKFIKYMQTPQTQATLATLKAYPSGVPNKKAIQYLPEEERVLLKMQSPEQMEAFISRLFVRELPKQQTEEEWQTVWQEFKTR